MSWCILPVKIWVLLWSMAKSSFVASSVMFLWYFWYSRGSWRAWSVYWLGYGLDGLGFEFTPFRLLRLTQPPVQRTPGFHPGVKRPSRELDHLPPNEWVELYLYTSCMPFWRRQGQVFFYLDLSTDVQNAKFCCATESVNKCVTFNLPTSTNCCIVFKISD